MVRRWIGILLALLLAAPAFALDPSRALTQYAHRIWQATQGLPEGTIYCVRQTKDGYMWLGTLRGLVRFDGVRFTRIEKLGNVEIGKAAVLDIAEGTDGTLWVATDGAGLVGWKDGVGRRMENLPSERVQKLLVDSKGTLWIATPEGGRRWADGKLTWGQQEVHDARAMCEGPDGRIWFGGDTYYVSVWDGKTSVNVKLPWLAGGITVQSLEVDEDGIVWAGTSAGLVPMTGGGKRLTTADGLPDDFVWCLSRGTDGALWVGTRGGFSRVRGGRVESYYGRDGLSQSTVYAMCEDREGSLWVGTKHGLDEFFDGRVISITTREGLASNDTGPILQDRAGIVWVGTLGEGLSRYDGKEFTTVREGLPSGVILSLAEGRDGELWVGTDKGLARMRGGKVVDVFADGLPDPRVPALVVDAGGKLWAGTPKGLAYLTEGERKFHRTGLADDGIVTLARRRGKFDHLIVSSSESGGAQQWGGEPSFSQLAGGRPVDAFYDDDQGMLWMGTLGGGLRLFDGKQSIPFTMRDGLFDDEIFAIVGDKEDRLWMACSKGVFSVSRQNLLNVAAKKEKQIVSAPFSPTDALRTIECKSGVEPAAWVMADGRLWFSTTRGVVVLDPSRLPRKLSPPRVVVEETAVDGRVTAPAGIAALPAGPKNLMFRYTGLSFISPGRITFRYQLEGFDDGWVDAGGRREAFYTNLPPGNYRFLVQAINVEGSWSDPDIQTAGVGFSLAPAWYQHAWFIPLCVAAAAALGALGFQMRMRVLRKRMQLVLAERSRIARELHDTLLQGFAGVTMEMQALSVRLPGESGERRTLDEIIRDAAVCLKEARRSVAGLRDRVTGGGGFAAVVESAAREIAAGSGLEIVMRAEGVGAVKLPGSVEFTLMRIAREAVTNAVKHAQAQRIEIGLKMEGTGPQQLVMEIADDGVGFAMEGAKGAEHYGLLGMRERAEEIGAAFEIVSAAGEGTVVRVTWSLEGGAQRGAVEKTTAATE